jgi:hypothetical protein
MINAMVVKVFLTCAVLVLMAAFLCPLFEVAFLSPDWFLLAFADAVYCAFLALIIKEIWDY